MKIVYKSVTLSAYGYSELLTDCTVWISTSEYKRKRDNNNPEDRKCTIAYIDGNRDGNKCEATVSECVVSQLDNEKLWLTGIIYNHEIMEIPFVVDVKCAEPYIKEGKK